MKLDPKEVSHIGIGVIGAGAGKSLTVEMAEVIRQMKDIPGPLLISIDQQMSVKANPFDSNQPIPIKPVERLEMLKPLTPPLTRKERRKNQRKKR